MFERIRRTWRTFGAERYPRLRLTFVLKDDYIYLDLGQGRWVLLFGLDRLIRFDQETLESAIATLTEDHDLTSPGDS